MIKFGEVFFCERVISNLDGTPLQYINRFSSRALDSYPDLISFSVILHLSHSSALHHMLTIRIQGSEEMIFESRLQRLISDQPDRPNLEVAIVARLHNVMIPEPGAYPVEILLNGDVRHTEVISFT